MRRSWLLGFGLALASCGAAEDMSAAGEQVAAFHRAYDARRFDALWDKSAPAMKQVTSKAQFRELMVALRQRLGTVKSTNRTGFNVDYDTGGSQVTLTYQTTFANGEGTETFIYDTDNPPRLMGWHVVSSALDGPGPAEVDKVDRASE